ncbi:uncharacterized protein FOMMEDRAFT_137084 [Fomitiporia mediterranea MF3/22]|uniref:uncharacterized protein n=1 Tax=Fomitiporia mediterranea (strain MF3/22) TaxID=694068 RepID=UPI0004408D08|nr:uncharacterized protein FOMMEDRAFT_137084 [Fomitiporia mediterranea MF3/22]EJC98487.1 hypothetical protein FOMMEDRAFT_137084 [Fomitiporia mediterranea MF3/22]
MRAIPPTYFRPSSPHGSRASTSHPAMPTAVPLPRELQVPSMRSSASSAASYRSDKGCEKEREGQKRTSSIPMAPAMVRGESSNSSSSGSSRGYGPSATTYYRDREDQQHPQRQRRSSTSASNSTAPSSVPSSSPSRTRSRRQSINQGSNPYPASRRERSSGNDAHANSIPHLREALSTLESQMASLQFERKKLETRLENAVRRQSPIQRIPGELLGSIFEIGVHRASGAEDALLLSTLMRVCKHWTDVALNTPVLWSKIVIDTPASLPKARRKLARSRAVPLDITIQFGPSVDPEAPVRGGQGGYGQAVIETVVHAMDLLQPAIWRWRSFRLAVPTHAHAAAALSQCTEAAPILEVLAVQVHHVMNDAGRSSRSLRQAPLSLNAFMDDDADAQLFGGQVPRLRVCALTSFDAGWGGPIMRGLTVLRLGGFWNGAAPRMRTLIDVLRACPELEELSLRNMSDVEGEMGNESCACFDFDGQLKSTRSHSHSRSAHSHSHSHSHSLYPRESDMVHLPRLRRASFYYSGVVRTAGLLAQMSFPALERLELSYLDNITPVLTHLKRQACSPPLGFTGDSAEWVVRDGRYDGGMRMRTGLPLVTLRIESCLFNELKLVRLLRRLPTIRKLELVDVEDVSASFLNGLSTPQSTHSHSHQAPQSSQSSQTQQEWICPLLDTLNFDGCSSLPWDALRAVVEARLPASTSAGARLLGPAARSSVGSLSSASGYAAHQTQRTSSSSSLNASARMSRAGSTSGVDGGPTRLRTLDLTRCPQISKEMIAWLRMYVDEVRVRCEAEQTYWGEFGFSE